MPVNQDEEQLYQEWKEFLTSSSRLDVQLAATEAVLAQVTSTDAVLNFLRHGMLSLLAKVASTVDIEESMGWKISVNALQAMVYLTSHGTTANQCVHEIIHGHESATTTKEDGVDATADSHPQSSFPRIIEIVTSTRIPTAASSGATATSSAETTMARRQRVNYGIALLANLTRTEDGAVEFMGRQQQEPGENPVWNVSAITTLQLLLERFLNAGFVNGAAIDERDRKGPALPDDDDEKETTLNTSANDPYQHFASLLMNLTQIDTGRAFCLKLDYNPDHSTNSVLQRLLPQLKSYNPLRRRGIAGLIRNCVLDGRDSVWWMLYDVKLLQYILYPLAGPEELTVEEKRGLHPDLWLEGPNKRREPDHLTRLFLVQALLLLCKSGRKAREVLQSERVSVVLKWADMVEEQEDVSESIQECLELLQSEEDETGESISSDRLVETAYRKMLEQQTTTSGENFDEVD